MSDPTRGIPAVGGPPPAGPPPPAPPGGPGGEGPGGDEPNRRKVYAIGALVAIIILLLITLILVRLGGGDDSLATESSTTTTSSSTSSTTTTSSSSTTTSTSSTTTTTAPASTTTSTTTTTTTTTTTAPPTTIDPARCRGTTGPDNPDPVAETFYDAWTVDDRSCAEAIATDEAIDTLFAIDGTDADWDFQACEADEETPEQDADCTFRYEGGTAFFELRFGPIDGWQVFDVDFQAD